jgi:hypothetical protein
MQKMNMRQSVLVTPLGCRKGFSLKQDIATIKQGNHSILFCSSRTARIPAFDDDAFVLDP